MNRTPICVLCEKPTGRKKYNPCRPCCRRCEKKGAPMAIQAPGLFTCGPAAVLAQAIKRRADSLNLVKGVL